MTSKLINPETDQKIEGSLDLIRRWGGITTDALLDPKCQLFTVPFIEGFIGYRNIGHCLVVFGDPICSPDDDAKRLAKEFHKLNGKKKIVYVATSKEFANWASKDICKVSVEFGEEFILDPFKDPRKEQGSEAVLVRKKVKRALNEGVSVKEYIEKEQSIEQKLQEIAFFWLQSRHGPQIHISHIHLFQNSFGKRWFYAQKDDLILGLVVLNKLEEKGGWLLNNLMVDPIAPKGTHELLVISVLEALKQEDCHYVSFGVMPTDELGEVIGLSQISQWIVRKAYIFAHKMFHLKGYQVFWGKFLPKQEPLYVLFSQSPVSIRETIALFRAMNFSIRK